MVLTPHTFAEHQRKAILAWPPKSVIAYGQTQGNVHGVIMCG